MKLDTNGGPGVARTRDPLLRRQMLYPSELRALDHILAEDDCPSQNVLKKSSLAGRRDRCAWDKFYSLALMPVRAFKESRRALAAADAHGYYAITAFAAG